MDSLFHARRLVLASIGSAFVALAACDMQSSSKSASKSASKTKTKTDAPAAGRVYVVGTNANYAPFESKNASGEISGFDIDIINAIAKEANIKVRFVDTPWNELFDSLVKGDLDILMSSITITEERRSRMDFSKPYFFAHQLIATRSGTPVYGLQDLKTHVVAVQKGTTGDQMVSKIFGEASPQIRRFESMLMAMDALKSGSVEAAVGDNGPISSYMNKADSSGLKTVRDSSTPSEYYGIAVKKGNQELLRLINQGLSDLKTKSLYESIYQKHFGGIPSLAELEPASAT